MARIPEKFIDDLLDRVDIVEVIDRRVKLRKSGKNFSACCPFHDEKTPSFSVNPEKQFFYCFGCGAGGNAIGFVMDYERMEFPEAIESLAQTCGLEVPREEAKPGEKPAQDSNRPLLEQLEQAARFYEHGLRHHEQASRAVAYLKSRGLSGEIARQFRIGFAPPGWDNLLTTLGSQETPQRLLMTGGMLVKNDKNRVYDRFRDRIMFPILDARGRVIAFGGRVLGDDKPKYLNSPETPVFQKSRELYGLYQARKSERSLERIVVVEGYMDVIALAQFGITYAVATLGTATSEAHLERLFRHVPEVVFCFDGDEAGRKAAFRALEATLPAMEDGRQARFLFLAEGEDPDTVVRDKGREHLEHLFDTATPLETFLFTRLAEGIDTGTLDGKARFAKMAAPFLAQLPEGVFKALMYQALAERTGIDIDSLKRLQTPPPEVIASIAAHREDTSRERPTAESSQYPRGEEPPSDRDEDGPPAWLTKAAGDSDNTLQHADETLIPSSRNPVHRLLGLLVLNPKLAERVEANTLPEADRHDLALLSEFITRVQAQPDISTAALLGFWYGTPQGNLLAELAGREPLEDNAGQAELFEALLTRVTHEEALSILRARNAELKAKNYESMTADEKQELLDTTRRIRALTGKA
ncbi:MAG: DNA primase [Proteobacteria bacterium]|nr:DNA primase [Pseudomonadota bacterium]